jgi:hypothetical protein
MKSKKKVSKSKSKKKVVKKRTSKKVNKSSFDVTRFPSVQLQNNDPNSYTYLLSDQQYIDAFVGKSNQKTTKTNEAPLDESDLLQDGSNTVEEQLNKSEQEFEDKLNKAIKKEKSNFLVRAWRTTVDFFWGE